MTRSFFYLLCALLACGCARAPSDTRADASASTTGGDRTPRECNAQPCMNGPDGRLMGAGEAIELWKKSGRTPPWEQDAAR